MAEIILSATQANSEVLGSEYAGTYEMVCLVHTGEDVNLQIRDPNYSENWIDLRDNGQNRRFQRAGDYLEFTLAQGFEYRFHTDAAGAVIAIDRIG